MSISFTIIVDTREQQPYSFGAKVDVVRHKLNAGDYSIVGCEDAFAIERKSLSDWLRTIIHCRDRFYRELERLSSYDRAYIVVEANWPDVLEGRYARVDKIKPSTVLGLTTSIAVSHPISIIFAGNRETARCLVVKLCEMYAKRHARKMKESIV